MSPADLAPRPARPWGAVAATALVVLGVGAAVLRPGSTSTWPSGAVSEARRIPIQDEGRVKPLDTYAQFSLLRTNHKRTCEDAEGRSIDAMDWLLDAMFRPERARTHRCFAVDDSQILDAIHLGDIARKKRDRYSFAELEPGRDELFTQAKAIKKKAEKERSPAEAELLALGHDLTAFESLLHVGDMTRERLAVDGSPGLAQAFEGRKDATIVEILAKADAIRALVGGPTDPHGGAPAAGDPAARALVEKVKEVSWAVGGLALVPVPPSPDAEGWWTPLHLVMVALQREPLPDEYAQVLSHWIGMSTSGSDSAAFEREVVAFRDATQRLAERQGEAKQVGLEVSFYRLDPFDRAVWLHLFAFLALAVTWLFASVRSGSLPWLRRAAWVLLLSAVALQVAGIVIRCVLRGRPPVSTLYETMLFIATVGTIGLLVTERWSRRGIALALTPVLGGALLIIAKRFEASKGEDTMPQLEAVLDTNFWLATHVVCITIGYCGGLLTALLGNAHVLGRALGIRGEEGYRAISKMNYGMLAFGLVFSVVGTILGGIWANESWGRFWGWDPKENGALLICLSQLTIIHGRLGAYLKPFGIAMASVALGGVVAFSWWGVNQLGIGLHSYGFSGGIMRGLMIFYGIEVLVLGAGWVTWLLGRAYGATPKALPTKELPAS